MNKPITVSNGSTILIGTCRIKRPRKLFEKEVRSRTTIVNSHVHYPAEILQMIRYLRGEIELSNEAIPWVIDDVNNGNITSEEALQQRRTDTRKMLDDASQVILEVSSLKKILLTGQEGVQYFANITSNSKLRNGICKADFVDTESSVAAFETPVAVISPSDEFVADLQAVIDSLPNKKIILVPHFQATNPKTGDPIAERVELARIVKLAALTNGCVYFDQSEIVNELGADVALTDTSHYTDAGEQAMARILAEMISSFEQVGCSKEPVT